MKNIIKIVILCIFSNSFNAFAMFKRNKVYPEEMVINIDEIKKNKLCDLPHEVLLKILFYLNKEDKAGVGVVNKEFRNLWLYDFIKNRESNMFCLTIKNDLLDKKITGKKAYKKRVEFIKKFKKTLQNFINHDGQVRTLKMFVCSRSFGEEVISFNEEVSASAKFDEKFEKFLKYVDRKRCPWGIKNSLGCLLLGFVCLNGVGGVFVGMCLAVIALLSRIASCDNSLNCDPVFGFLTKYKECLGQCQGNPTEIPDFCKYYNNTDLCHSNADLISIGF